MHEEEQSRRYSARSLANDALAPPAPNGLTTHELVALGERAEEDVERDGCVEVAPVWVGICNGKKSNYFTRVRSAVTGRFVKRGRAKTSPRTTVTERFRRSTGKNTGKKKRR